MAKEYITIRLETECVNTIDQLVRVGATESRSDFIRKATKALLSQYTGEVDVNNIEKRLREVESRINILEVKVGGL